MHCNFITGILVAGSFYMAWLGALECKGQPQQIIIQGANPSPAEQVATRKICDQYGCPLEFILKDISTVRYEPERLAEWSRIAMQVVGG